MASQPFSEVPSASATWRFAWENLRPHRGILFAAAGWRMLFRLLPVQTPLLTGALIDGLSGRSATAWGYAFPEGDPAAAVGQVGFALALVAVLTGTTAFVSGRMGGHLRRTCVRGLRLRVLAAWEYASAAFHRQKGASELFDRTLSSTRSLGNLALTACVEGSAVLVRLLYPALMLLAIDPWMAVFPLAVLPAQFALIRAVQRRQNAFASSIRESKSRLRCDVRENLAGIETVQALGAQALFLDRIAGDAEQVEKETTASGLYGALLTGGVWGLAALAMAGSWWAGGYRVLSGEMSVGTLVAFAGFAAYLSVPLRRIARLASETRRALNALQEVSALLGAAQADAAGSGASELHPGPGAVVLRDVRFAYRRRAVLRGVSATLPPGEMIWLRGRSGCGKSTLLRLLARFDVPASGSIAVDGQDLRDCTSASVREHIALVPQNAAVFSGTIAANLLVGRPEATPDELLWACTVSGLEEVLQALDDGLATMVGERGLRLSGGQAQRLAVARALLRRPRVLLLDEPTAGLDAQDEERLFARLAALTPRMTVVIVAHRVRSLAPFQRVFELDEGVLREWPLTADPAIENEEESSCLTTEPK